MVYQRTDLPTETVLFCREVFKEWIFYEIEQKPIHALYLRQCRLHSRLYEYQHEKVLIIRSTEDS